MNAMTFETIICHESDTCVSRFWNGIGIYLHHPHVVNRRVLVSLNELTAEIVCQPAELIAHFLRIQDPSNFLSNTLCTVKENNLEYFDKLEIVNDNILLSLNSVELSANKILLCVKKMIPREEHLFSPTIEFAFINKQTNSVTFLYHAITSEKQSLGPVHAFTVQYKENQSIYINIVNIGINKNPGVEWLKKKFYPRLIKWIENESPNNNLVSGSLALVPPEKYANLYNELKKKYGPELVKMWPECTDPAKFVYEDIAIASYLLLLWEKEREEKGISKLQSFLDLGCGNGLLVYILSSEGHEGRGTDLRKRKIWDLFPETTHLHVETIIPSTSTLYPEVDWLIGNHSDELTPWIPVIAARSSYTCRFFLLPCCSYEFDGAKYRRYSASTSQYSEYISYIRTVCETCGFRTNIDKLRIPSTKRTCLIGWERNYAECETDLYETRIEGIINARSINVKSSTRETCDSWSTTFKPRDTTEKVRNCTQLNKNLIADIVHIVSQALLKNGSRVPVEDKPGVMWNTGREIELRDIVKSVPPDMLGQLKNECGGLQTLLKNHSYIFNVKEGKVKFRIPGTELCKKKRRANKPARPIKKRTCWFYENHPDGCLLSDVKCTYKH